MNIVCYTDGGARPNPGNMGWGGFGYVYKETQEKPIRNLENKLFTTLGYEDKLEKDSVFVVPEHVFTLVGSHENTNGTNNIAELNAFITTLKHILIKYKDIEHILLLTDSSYTKDGVTSWLTNWKKFNWIKQDGTPVANKEHWLIIDDILSELKNKNITLKIEWVKAHSVSYGNHTADKLATLGVSLSKKNRHHQDGLFKSTPYSEYKKLTIEKHPFINFKRMYFNNIKEKNKFGLYYLTDDRDDNDKSNTNTSFITKRSSKTSFAVIKMDKPEEVLDSIMNKRFDMMVEQEAITIVKVDRIYTNGVYEYVKEFKDLAFLDACKRPSRIDFLDNTPIAIDLDPPGPVLNAFTQFDLLKYLLEDYLSKENNNETILDDLSSPNVSYCNITDTFYDVIENKNGKKQELKKDISDKTMLKIKYNEHVIPIITGVDLLPRNNLKRIEKEDPSIILVTWLHEANLLRYATIIKVNDAVGIWSNIYAGAIVLK